VTAFVLTFSFLLGSLIGSFTNVLIHRIPRKESIAFPPSRCPKCGHRLGVLDLFPIFSWLFLRGKCRYCGAPISPRYPVVELISGTFYALIAWKYPPLEVPILTVGFWFFFTCLLAGSAIDLETLELPDELTIPVIGVGLLIFGWLGSLSFSLEGALLGGGMIAMISGYGSWVLRRFKEPRHPAFPMGYINIHVAALVGALLAFVPDFEYGWLCGLIAGLAVTGLNYAAKRVVPIPDNLTLGATLLALIAAIVMNSNPIGVISNLLQAAGAMAIVLGIYWWFAPDEETDEFDEQDFDPVAMGFGDVKLWAGVGAFLGWQGALFGLGVAVAVGAFIGIINLARGGSRTIPFGPFLAVGALVALFTDSAPLYAYLEMLGF
jgi:leader peptidase (prepilin peptidase) / N-methyltransferase